MEVNKPLISCIIPTFNRASLLKDAIESCINQTYENWELIIINDGSVDNTEEVVKEYSINDLRIKYFKNDKKGQSSARNLGIKKSIGEYIAFLDDDDISLPHRFESQLKAIQNSGKDFIVSGYQVRERETNKLISENKLELKGSGAGFPSRWLISRDLLILSEGFKEHYPSMEEVELSYRLSNFTRFALHDDIVTVMYPTELSVSRNINNNLNGMLLMMSDVKSLMPNEESAWWYFTIARSYYIIKDNINALKYFQLAKNIDNRINFKISYYHCRFTNYFNNNLIRRFNNFIFSRLGKYRFPSVVKHEVVK